MSHKILACDDHRHITRIIEMTLYRSGYDVHVADNGDDAWELYQAISPQLLITDQDMPGMRGSELCRRIRRERSAAELPMILLTARAFELCESREILDVDFARIIMKPFSPLELRTLVAQLLRRADQEPVQISEPIRGEPTTSMLRTNHLQTAHSLPSRG